MRRQRRARARFRRRVAQVLTGVLVGGIVFAGTTAALLLSDSGPAVAATGSAAVVKASEYDPDYEHSPFPDLEVTVSQTADLVQQGIRVSWTGAARSTAPSSQNGGTNFLQIFQCWGDDPEDPTRPDRTTCQYGGATAPGASRDAYRSIPFDAIPEEDLAYTAPGGGFLPAYSAIPFTSRAGDTVSAIVTDPVSGVKSIDSSVDINNNAYFTKYTTNEVPWAGSGEDGTGSVAFELQTAAQSPALGCGSPIAVAGGTEGAACWLVVLPRGASDNGSVNITQSGLFIESWSHALAVRLDFRPLGARCPEGSAERQIAGSELASLAVNSWQPVVCNQAGGSVYSLLTGAESDALLAASGTAAAPLALSSMPLRTSGTDPLRYAPVALTGVTIAFSIDRQPTSFGGVPDEYVARAQLPFLSMNLTPRLLAKLMTNSYRASLPTGADTNYLPEANPYNLTEDPEFLAVNDPEWSYQALSGPAIADVIVPQGRSDAAMAIWQYIVADPEARAFLAGQPDEYGMVVNHWYSTDAAINPTGTAFVVPRDNFPKADPVEVTPAGLGPVNLVTWRPYANDLDSAGYFTLRGDGQTLGEWQPLPTPAKYLKAPRMLPGFQRVLGLTDTASASRYQVVTASLRNPAGEFVAPTSESLLIAAAAMTPVGGNGQVLGLVQDSAEALGAPGAYPLTMPVYAAANPATKDATLRSAYAAFIKYAVGDGQTPGSGVGQLPDGFAPIPQAWHDRAIAAADAIAAGPQPAPPATTTRPPAQTSFVTAPAPVVSSAPNPSATGDASGPLLGDPTAEDPKQAPLLQAALPIGIGSGVAAAIALPFITRRRPL